MTDPGSFGGYKNENPSVIELLEHLHEITKQFELFLMSLKSYSGNRSVMKRVIHHPRVKTFVKVYLTKILMILGNTLKTKHIKNSLSDIQLRSQHQDQLNLSPSNPREKKAIDTLAVKILETIMGMKGMVQHSLVLLADVKMTKSFDLDSMIGMLVSSNSKPQTLSYYFGLVSIKKIDRCCSICGSLISDQASPDHFFNSNLLAIKGSHYHTDCFKFWNWRKSLKAPSLSEPLLLL